MDSGIGTQEYSVYKLDGGTPADEWSHHESTDGFAEFHSSQNLGFSYKKNVNL